MIEQDLNKTTIEEKSYVGEYKNGWFHGNGTYIFPNKIKYIGIIIKLIRRV